MGNPGTGKPSLHHTGRGRSCDKEIADAGRVAEVLEKVSQFCQRNLFRLFGKRLFYDIFVDHAFAGNINFFP